MKNILIIIILSLASFINAQDLHIYYDVFSDSTWYMKNGKSIEEPTVKKGNKAYLHLIEYNNYIYRANVDVNQYSQDQNADPGTQNLFKSLIPGVLGSLIPGNLGGGLPFMDVPVYGKILNTLTGTAGQTAARGEQEEVQNFKNQVVLLENEKNQINTLVLEINKRKKATAMLKASPEFINDISKLESIKPSQIRSLMFNYLNGALLVNDSTGFTAEDIQRLNFKLLEIPSLEQQANEKLANFNDEMKNLKKQVTILKGVDHGIDELYDLLGTLSNSEKEINKDLTTLTALVVKDSLSGETDYTKDIYKYFLKYLELSNNKFAYTQETDAEQRYLNYNVKLTKINTLNSGADNEEFRSKSFDVRIYGNLFFTPSIGLAAGKFQKEQFDYSVSDNVIIGDKKTPVSLMITSMVNVGYDFNSLVSPALSFGVGIPITSEEALSNINFLVGPSLMLGRSRSFLLTGGWSFSKATRLGKGLQVGDTVDLGDGELPSKRAFEIGYFVGLNYRFSGN